ncbi:golgin subfamily A member 3 isoform X2 [Lingula anatina]|uniref:Golgin subfamily A member 3 isoform X2 n=1 Tax=Lingula anatina TaxID=7574 RepID=A0A1S3KGW2_LINAN|nr:golgin subfamily A member 3 isoform X2 [Lingula anatina]|eukprot:XP_013421878.1 golgin subfamily A member 3 isoform X2 [Lingula anatina]
MEPFELRFHQVNFEAEDIPQNQTLDSFSNVVSYQYDELLSSANGTAVNQSNVQEDQGSSRSHSRSSPIHRTIKIEEVATNFHSASRPSVEGADETSEPELVEEALPGVFSTCSYHSTLHNDIIHNSSSSDTTERNGTAAIMEHNESFTRTSSSDSFTAFTNTVDALALQKSVIGSSALPPASNELIAQAIADAEKKLKLAKNGTSLERGDNQISREPSISKGNNEILQANGSVADQSHPHGVTIDGTDNPHTDRFNNDLLELPDRSNTDPYQLDGSSPQPMPQNLIRVPQELITITKTKSVVTGDTSNDFPQLGNDTDAPQEYFEELKVDTAVHTEEEIINQQAEGKTEKENKVFNFGDGDSNYAIFPDRVTPTNDMNHEEGNVTPTPFNSANNCNNFNNANNCNNFNTNTVLISKGQSIGDTFRECAIQEDLDLDQIEQHALPPNLGPVGTSTPVREKGQSPAPQFRTVKSDEDLWQQYKAHGLPIKGYSEEAGEMCDRSQSSSRSSEYGWHPGLPQGLEGLLRPELTPLDGRSRSSSISSLATSATETFDVEQLLKEKANLEGQLEVMSTEAKNAMQERAQLQAQLAAMKSQVSQASSSFYGSKGNELLTELQLLRQSSKELRHHVSELERSSDDKSLEIRNLQDELDVNQTKCERLQNKVEALRQELQGKDMTAQDLKNKVAELYVELQTSLQVKMQAESEIQSLRSDIEGYLKKRDWFQQQLTNAQEIKTQLQQEVASLKTLSVQQGNEIEKLKAENVDISHRHADLQQKVLQDKEQLANHLESIEYAMMEREAMFDQIKRQQGSAEEVLKLRMQKVEEERERLSSVTTSVADLEAELKKSSNELRVKEARIGVLEHEQAELMKRLTLSTKELQEREATIEMLRQSALDTDVRLKGLQQVTGSKDEVVLILREDNARLQVELDSALREKEEVERSIDILRDDLMKLEQGFLVMKQSVSAKEMELDKLKHENQSLERSLEAANSQIYDQRIAYDRCSSDLTAAVSAAHELQSQKLGQEIEISRLKNELNVAQSSQEKSENSRSEVASLKEKLNELKQKLEDATKHNVYLEGQLETTSDDQGTIAKLTDENTVLKIRVRELETQTQSEASSHAVTVSELEAELSKLQSDLHDKQSDTDNIVAELREKLAYAKNGKDLAVKELEVLRKRSEEDQEKQRSDFNKQIEALSGDLEATRNRKLTLEAEIMQLHKATENVIEDYKKKIGSLERDLQKSKEHGRKHHKSDTVNKKLMLELEREKGRLSGVLQSQSALKQHTSVLEEALALRESSITELSATAQGQLIRKDQVEAEYRGKITALEESLAREKDSVKGLKKQLMVQKGETVKLRREIETMHLDIDQLQKDLEQKKQAAHLVEVELGRAQQAALQYQTDLESLNSQHNSGKVELERVSRELSEEKAQQAVLVDQIKTLQWQLEQKSQEAKALQDKLTLAEERQKMELQSSQKSLQGLQAELEAAKCELAGTRKEKFSYQAKVSELHDALRSSVEQTKILKSQNTEDAVTGTMASFSLPTDYDIAAIEQLLNQSAPIAKSRPLENIQTCLASLRSEMTVLQKQLDVHTAQVQNTSKSWKEVEAQAEELRQMCRTPVSVSSDSVKSDQ